MILLLQSLPQLEGPPGDGYGGLVPKRMLYMRPESARALVQIEADTGGLIYTDLLRSAQATRDAYRTKVTPSGQHISQPVSYSYHEYGGPVDLDVERSLKKLGTNYDGLVEIMAARGFYCHRRDGNPTASESWHFNYLGPDADELLGLTTTDHATWSHPAEAMIQKWYGPELQPNDDETNELLHTAGVSDVRTFQRAWDLVVDGVAGPKTRRVLAFVTAQQNIETDPPVAA